MEPYDGGVAVSIEIVIDCEDPDRAADFWAAVLGYVRTASAANYRVITDPAGVGPKVILQGVPEAKSGKNRVHIDVLSPDIESEARRLEALGARRLAVHPIEEHGGAWILMADPDGNEVCVCRS